MRKTTFNTKLNLFLTLSFIFFLSSINAQAPKELLLKAITETSGDARGVIKDDEGAFRLDYDDVYETDTHAKFLQEKGYHGGGPSWLGIIYGAFHLCDNKMIDSLDSDVSVTGVSFWSDKKEELEIVKRVISVIKSDDAILLEVIEIAKKEDAML